MNAGLADLSNMAMVVLAAGHGQLRRGKSKLLELFAGEPLLFRAVQTAKDSGFGHVVVVVNTKFGEDIRDSLIKGRHGDVLFAHQEERQGPANAVQKAIAVLQDKGVTDFLVGFGDMPFQSVRHIRQLASCHLRKRAWASYSSWVADPSVGLLEKMVNYAYVDRESCDGHANGRPLVYLYTGEVPPEGSEVLSSLYAFNSGWFQESYLRLTPFSKGDGHPDEYHLPLLLGDDSLAIDLTKLGNTPVYDPREIVGVNTSADMEMAVNLLQGVGS